MSESSPATTPTNAVTSSSNPTLAAWPTVAQKEPRNCALHEQVVGSVLAPATNPLGWILPILPPPFMGNKVDPYPGRIRTRSLNNAHCVRRPFPQWILRLPQNMIPARLQKVMLMVIKGVYHECFAVTHCTDFDYSHIMAQAFHRKSIGLGSFIKLDLPYVFSVLFLIKPVCSTWYYVFLESFKNLKGCFDSF